MARLLRPRRAAPRGLKTPPPPRRRVWDGDPTSSVAAADARARGFASGWGVSFFRALLSLRRVSPPGAHGRGRARRCGEGARGLRARRRTRRNEKRSSDEESRRESAESLGEAGSVASDSVQRRRRTLEFEGCGRLVPTRRRSRRVRARRARVAAVLAARREERAKAQARVDGEAEAREGDESGTGAWAGAAARAARGGGRGDARSDGGVGADARPAAFDDESRSSPRDPCGGIFEPTTRSTDARARVAKTKRKSASPGSTRRSPSPAARWSCRRWGGRRVGRVVNAFERVRRDTHVEALRAGPTDVFSR